MLVSAVNNVNFGSEKVKKQREYKRTDAFKIAGAATGAALSSAGIIGFKISAPPEVLAEFGTGKLALCAVGLTAIGTLGGALYDCVINKIVKNTTLSINKKEA